MEVSFTKQYLNALDSFLNTEYNLVTRREDFLALLARIELFMSNNENEDKAWFEKHKYREYFGKTGPRGYQEYKLDIMLKTLERKNILVITPYDKSRGKTRSYFYQLLFHMEYKESENEIIKVKIPEKYRRLFIKETKIPEKVELKLQYDLLMSQRFKVDTNLALKWINDQYNRHEIISNQKRNYVRMILSIDDKLIYTIEGDKGGRVYTNFTNLKKELRQFCLIDEQKLMSIDLKSSQPYLMAQFMMKNWPVESASFYEIVTKEDIYLFFLNRWLEANPEGFYKRYNVDNRRVEKVYLRTRDDIKPEYLKMLFKINGRKPELDKIFKKEFPFVYHKVQDLKLGLASALQREESSIFIPVCTEFAERGCLSVHDSLYFKQELYQPILESLRSKFNEKGYKDFKLNVEDKE